MLAVDTNVVVRYLVRDDPDQAARAASLIDGEAVWLALTVALECEWALRSAYRYSPTAITAALRTFVGQNTVTVEQPAALRQALDLYEAGMDFADALHVAAAAPTAGFRTFDAALAKQAASLGLPQVRKL